MADAGAAAGTPTRYSLRHGARPAWLSATVGVVVVVALWWFLAATVFAGGKAVPTPWAVVRDLGTGGWGYYATNAAVTLRAAAVGFTWGNGLALLLAAFVLLVPPLEALVTQLAVISYCMPLTAIGPIILIVFPGRAPEQFLAAISVFFTTLVGSLLGLRAADRASLDLVTAYGGSRVQRLTKVQVVSALPPVLSALKLAAPAAMLGAIIGEYLGGVDNGIGQALTVAQQSFNVPRVWAWALVATALAGAGYLVFSLIARFVTPWAAGDPS